MPDQPGAEEIVHDCDARDAGDGVYCAACCPCDDCTFRRRFEGPCGCGASSHFGCSRPRRVEGVGDGAVATCCCEDR